MAELCINLVPLFNALPIDEQMQIEELVHHQNYRKNELVLAPTSNNNLIIYEKKHLFSGCSCP